MDSRHAAPCPPARRLLLALAFGLWLAPAPAGAGVDLRFHVLDQEAFETRILPAYRYYVHGHDPSKLKALLRETIDRLGARPLPSRHGLGESPLVEVTRALAMLEGETGFDEQYLPRVRSTPPTPTRQEKLDLLVKGDLVPLLVEIWCLQRADGQIMALDLWSSPLWRHLNASRPWLKEEFYGAAPEGEHSLEVSTCEFTTVLSPWWVARLEAELSKVPPPAGEAAAADLRLLRRMVELVRANPAFRLVLEGC